MRKDLTPFGQIKGLSIFDEFDNIFSRTFANMIPANQQNNYPVCNVYVDTDDVLNFEFALAGFTKEDIVAEIEGNILTVKAEKTTEEEQDENKYIVRRFAKRSFTKQYDLGELYDTDSAQVDFTDGVLRLTFNAKELEEIETNAKRLAI